MFYASVVRSDLPTLLLVRSRNGFNGNNNGADAMWRIARINVWVPHAFISHRLVGVFAVRVAELWRLLRIFRRLRFSWRIFEELGCLLRLRQGMGMHSQVGCVSGMVSGKIIDDDHSKHTPTHRRRTLFPLSSFTRGQVLIRLFLIVFTKITKEWKWKKNIYNSEWVSGRCAVLCMGWHGERSPRTKSK